MFWYTNKKLYKMYKNNWNSKLEINKVFETQKKESYTKISMQTKNVFKTRRFLKQKDICEIQIANALINFFETNFGFKNFFLKLQ